MSKECIDTISNTIFEYKENLDSADYKLVMDELGKLNAMESPDTVKLKLLKQNLVLDKNSDSLDTYSITKSIEERYFPLKMFRNHYATDRDDYIAKFEDLKKHQGHTIVVDRWHLKNNLIVLLNKKKENEIYFVCTGDDCDNQNCDCKCFEIYYDKYILLDCEIV